MFNEEKEMLRERHFLGEGRERSNTLHPEVIERGVRKGMSSVDRMERKIRQLV